MQLVRSTVSSIVDVNLHLYRQMTTTASPWKAGDCFELQVVSPYADPLVYQSFTRAPVCTSPLVTVDCKVKLGTTDTIQFSFQEMTDYAQAQQSISLTISNFNTPYSAQKLSQIRVRSFSDAQCTKDKQEVRAGSISIKPAFLPDNAIKIRTTSDELGAQGEENSLIVTFTPQTQMSPTFAGRIELGIPFLWQQGMQNELMYDGDAEDQCFSDCMSIISSGLSGTQIRIIYDHMLPECVAGKQITIECSNFRNPIYQDSWDGFFVKTMDNESSYAEIDVSGMTPSLDATRYRPKILTSDHFIVMPGDSTVRTESEWIFQLFPPLPMMKECYIVLTLPHDLPLRWDSISAMDLFLPRNLNSILANGDFGLESTSEGQTIKFQGCNDESSLGKEPKGTVFISSITQISSVKDSGVISLTIYKDELQTQLIAQLENNYRILASEVTHGWLKDVSLYPMNYRVQSNTFVYVTLTISHALEVGAKLEVKLPQGFTVPPIGESLTVIGLRTVTSNPNPSTFATKADVIDNHLIEIRDFVSLTTAKANTKFWFILDGLQTQTSAKDAGEYTITTFVRSGEQFYTVDHHRVPSSFIATKGHISADGEVLIDQPLVDFNDATYEFKYRPESRVPQGGLVTVTFPPSVTFASATVVRDSLSCHVHECATDSQVIRLIVSEDLQRDLVHSLIFRGVQNPRSFQPSDSFLIETFDTDHVSKIDSGFQKSVQMSQAGSISRFSVSRESKTNGQVNKYSFSIESSVPLIRDDILKFTFPGQVSPNAGGLSMCEPSDSLFCTVSDRDVTVTILKEQAQVSLTLTNIRNPISLEPTSGFQNVFILDAKNFVIAQQDPQTVLGQLKNTQPATMTQLKLIQASYVLAQPNQYTLKFKPVNELPPTTLLLLEYPRSIEMTDGIATRCIITTNQVFADKCTIDTDQRTVTIRDAFTQTSHYSDEVTITLQDVTNPSHTLRMQGFNLRTYTDNTKAYLIDVAENVMVPRLSCNYPCASCRSDDPDYCTSCYLSQPDFPWYLVATSDSGRSTCERECPRGFTTNGQKDLVCTKCDESCAECKDEGVVGDASICTVCAASFPFTYGSQCFQSCQQGQGLFLAKSSDTECSLCSDNCYSCEGEAHLCTDCDQASKFSILYGTKCVASCPTGMLNIEGVCVACDPSCLTCEGSKTRCMSCDQDSKLNILFAQSCYDVCPAGQATSYETLECLQCQTGCSECDLENVEECFKCLDPLILFESVCVSSCPGGMLAGPDRIGCILNQLEDMTLLYFPFLIAACLFATIASCGRLKKKWILVDGKPTKVSEQRTLSTVLSFLAPLQTIACVTQCVLALVQGYYLLFVLVLITVALIALCNLYYLRWYHKSFVRTLVPEIGTQVKDGKKYITVTAANQQTYPQPLDFQFYQHLSKHRSSTYFVLASCLVHYQITHLLFSHFYGFDVFKASWTNSDKFVRHLKMFQCVFIAIVDLPLIAISVFGLLLVPMNTQLFITLCETPLITLALATLTLIEKRNLSKLFDRSNNNKYRATAMKDWKRIRMKNMILKVRKADYFQVRKLEEILKLFGDRPCKSAIELKGQDRVDDPRLVYTWPVSPDYLEELMDCQVSPRFGPLKSPVATPRVMSDKSQFGNLEKEEFLAILGRKQSNLHAPPTDFLGELEQQRMQQKRGRKNKYRHYIDDEDDQDQVNDEFAKLLAQKAFEESQLDQLMQMSKQKQKELERIRTSSPQSVSKVPKKVDSSRVQATKKAAAEAEQTRREKQKKKPVKVAKTKPANAEIKLKDNSATVMDLRPLQHDMQRPVFQQKSSMKSRCTPDEPQTADPHQENTTVALNQNALKPFLSHQQQGARTFNENDILGDVSFDTKGNLKGASKAKNHWLDKKRHPVNNCGYLIKPKTGDVINTLSVVQFKKSQLTKEGNLPGPYCIEKHNFNPHLLCGDLRGKTRNEHGWYTAANSQDIVDNRGYVKLRVQQQLEGGEIPPLFNMAGVQFNIRSVMGSIEKDSQGDIIPTTTDKQGRLVNEKGYLTNSQGDIIDDNGKVLFLCSELKNGEFMKVFAFTKFNQAWCRRQAGDKRPANAHGYLVDPQGNILDQSGNILLDKAALTETGDLPPVFRTTENLGKGLQSSTISRLMDEIDKIHEEGQTPAGIFDCGDTSDGGCDDSMDGTGNKVKFDIDDVEAQENFEGRKIRLRKRQRAHIKTIEILDLADKDREMAKVYSGQPGISVKRLVQPKPEHYNNYPKPRKIFRVDSHESNAKQNCQQKVVKTPSAVSSLHKQLLRSKDQQQQSKNQDQTKVDSSPPLQDQSAEFEKLYGKNIEKFLEDSEWDIESLDKMSWSDGAPIDSGFIDQQVSDQKPARRAVTHTRKRRRQREEVPSRETLIHMTDDPVAIHHGALLEFRN